VIGVSVCEDQVLELARRTANPADRVENGRLLVWEPGVDQRQSVVGFNEERVCHPHRDDLHAADHLLCSHGQKLRHAVCAYKCTTAD
jgi:hypothetical protein